MSNGFDFESADFMEDAADEIDAATGRVIGVVRSAVGSLTMPRDCWLEGSLRILCEEAFLAGARQAEFRAIRREGRQTQQATANMLSACLAGVTLGKEQGDE